MCWKWRSWPTGPISKSDFLSLLQDESAGYQSTNGCGGLSFHEAGRSCPRCQSWNGFIPRHMSHSTHLVKQLFVSISPLDLLLYHGVVIGFLLAKDGFKEFRDRVGWWAQVSNARILAGALPWVRSQWQSYKVDTRQPKTPKELACLEEIIRHWTRLPFRSIHVRFLPHSLISTKTNLLYSTASSTAGAAAAASARHEYKLDYTYSTFCFVTLWVYDNRSSKYNWSLTTWQIFTRAVCGERGFPSLDWIVRTQKIVYH